MDVAYGFMLRYSFTSRDVATLRFGISPLTELGLGLRALRSPDHYPLQAPWLARIDPVLGVLDMDVLMGLVDERRWVADFLGPRPRSASTGIDQELRALSRLSPEVLLRDVEALHGSLPPAFRGAHDAVMSRLIEALATTWHLCFEPHWQRMRGVLNADITHRGRVLASGGYTAMFESLSPKLGWDGKHLDLHLSSTEFAETRPAGRGMTLIPSMFVSGISTPIDAGLPPMLMYPARGQGAMWSADTGASPAAVAELLGETRARLLGALGEPASSTELASRFGVSTSAVNQHLRVLERGGLLNRTRYGRSVLYYRSDLGDALTSPAG